MKLTRMNVEEHETNTVFRAYAATNVTFIHSSIHSCMHKISHHISYMGIFFVYMHKEQLN